MLALAAGHGSKRSHRSSRGAQYAVEATVNAAHGFFASPEPPFSGGDLAAALRDAFSRDMLDR